MKTVGYPRSFQVTHAFTQLVSEKMRLIQHTSSVIDPSASKSGLNPGQVPEGAGGPGQGDWEMHLVCWQTPNGGQGPLRLGR